MCIFVVVSGLAVINVIGGFDNTVQRLSVSDSFGISRLQDGPYVPVQYMEDASATVDHRTRITLTGGFANVNGSSRYDLVWHLETTDATPRWTRGPNLLNGRRSHISFRLGTHLYVGMGRNANYVTELSGLESLDTTTQSSPVWEQSEPSYPLNVSEAACVVIENQGVDEVWVTGGNLASGSRTNAVYSWRGPGYKWQQQTNMSKSRYAHSMASDGVCIWVVGGKEKHNVNGEATVEVYYNGTWSLVSPLPAWHYGSISVLWGNFLVQMGGWGPAPEEKMGRSQDRNRVFVMSVTTGSWSLSDIYLTNAIDASVALITP